MTCSLQRVMIGIAAVVTCASVMAQNIPGAIFTTTKDGQTTNGNRIYTDKKQVYLNGGPQNMLGNTGLVPGNYYFMVTDPSGKVLLSSDAIGRRVLVVNEFGRVYGVPSTGGPYHAVGTYNPDNGSLPVQLWPFANTPNKGGVYKAWMTRVDDWDDTAPGNYFGFIHSKSKTDNFMVRKKNSEPPPPPPASTISFLKFYDANANGEYDAGDVPIPGFKLVISYTDNSYLNHPDEVHYTDANGLVSINTAGDTPFTAVEVLPLPIGGTWVQSYPNAGSGATNQFLALDGTYGYSGNTPPSGGSFEGAFGNYVAIAPTGGHTIGFWGNNNGEIAMGAAGLAFVNGLTAADENGLLTSTPKWADFAAWDAYLQGANAWNMAYMLSAQYLATSLNAWAGYITGPFFVPNSATSGGVNINTWLAGLGIGTPAVGGRMYSLAELFAAAEAQLNANPVTVTSSGDRTTQSCLKDIFDGINNNGGSVIPGLSTVAPPIPVFYYTLPIP